VNNLLRRQIRAARRAGTDDALDIEALLKAVDASYEDFERERRVSDHAQSRMEAELVEANTRLRQETAHTIAAIFGAVSEGILVLDQDGRIEGANPAAERLFGRPTGVLFGNSLCDLLAVDCENACTHGALAVGKVFEAELSRDGAELVALEISVSAFVRDRKPKQLVIMRDVSERRRREQALIAAQEAAVAANLAKSNFLASMSHELRTPLNAIIGYSETIRDRIFGAEVSDRYVEYAGVIWASGHHLLSLINDILDLSKIESGHLVLECQPIDLVPLVQQAVNMVRPDALRKGLRLDVLIPEAPVLVSADDRAMRQILLNLLSNAVKFTPADGVVQTAIETGEQVALAVRDSGIGIADEDLPHLFEPFRRANAHVAREHPGTGLGLAITRRLVDMHGGDITIESERGRGTLVKIQLPRIAA
jgi:PAS domain S-box-containing protein